MVSELNIKYTPIEIAVEVEINYILRKKNSNE
jgi:hypothetical protein